MGGISPGQAELVGSSPPPGRAWPQGKDASEDGHQTRPEAARSRPRHRSDRKDQRPRSTARRAQSAAPAPDERAAGIPRGPRRSAEGEGEIARFIWLSPSLSPSKTRNFAWGLRLEVNRERQYF